MHEPSKPVRLSAIAIAIAVVFSAVAPAQSPQTTAAIAGPEQRPSKSVTEVDRGRIENAAKRIDQTLEKALAQLGHAPTPLASDAEFLRHVFASNVDSVFFCVGEAVKRMSTRHGGKGGAIVNISSAAARMGGVPGWAAYAASKGAVDSFVMNAAKDLGPQGIRICGLRPGMTRTEMLQEIGGEARIQLGLPTISLGRAAEPEEIAEAAVFLASPRASYIHGTTIDVTGGR